MSAPAASLPDGPVLDALPELGNAASVAQSTDPVVCRRHLCSFGFGADDYESDVGEHYVIVALRENTPVGNLTYEDRGDYIRIRWVDVPESCQRQGIATALVRKLAHDHPVVLTTGGFTEDGEALFAAVGIDCADEPDDELDAEDLS